MKKITLTLSPVSDVWSAEDLDFMTRLAKFITLEADKVGADLVTSILSDYANHTTQVNMESTVSVQKDLFATTDLPNKNY